MLSLKNLSMKIKKIFIIQLKQEQKRNIGIAVAAGIVYSAMLVGTPFLVSVILQSAEKGTIFGVHYSIGILIAILLIYCVVTMLLYLLNRKAINDFVLSVKLYIEEKTVQHILRYENSASKTANVINNDIPSLCELYYRNIFKILNSMAFILFGLIYSAIVNIWAIIIELLFLLMAIVIHLFFKNRISSGYDLYREKKQETIGGITGFINGKLTIQSNDAYLYAQSAVGGFIHDKAKAEFFYQIFKKASNIIIGSIPVMATLFSAIFFSYLISEGALDKKAALAAAYVVGYIIWELIKIVPILNDFSTVRSIREYVSLVTSTDNIQMETPSRAKGSLHSVKLFNVSVRMSGKTILHDINLELCVPGKYLIIGKSGSGKSTLLNTIMGSIDFTGSVSDDTDSGGCFRNLINYLPQSVEVFPGSVSNNIAVCEHFSDSDIKIALKRSNYEDINLNETIEPSLMSFSGGELKKIAFARALFHKDSKPIMLMDEPFEGLDSESRSVIEKEILSHDGLTCVTSHILDTDFARQFDQIIIIEDGTVAFLGDYEDIPFSIKQYYFGEESRLTENE